VSSVQFIATNILQNPIQNAQLWPAQTKVWGVGLPHWFVSRTMCQHNKTVFFSVKKDPLFLFIVLRFQRRRREQGASKFPNLIYGTARRHSLSMRLKDITHWNLAPFFSSAPLH
jgi:hypothetical protein